VSKHVCSAWQQALAALAEDAWPDVSPVRLGTELALASHAMDSRAREREALHARGSGAEDSNVSGEERLWHRFGSTSPTNDARCHITRGNRYATAADDTCTRVQWAVVNPIDVTRFRLSTLAEHADAFQDRVVSC
jgi:hypothetical protein